jgi:hypothetical protein
MLDSQASVGADLAQEAGPRKGEPGPPQFLFAEVVRVVDSTGAETDDFGTRIDTRPLIGRELVVLGASPTGDRDGWLIHLAGGELGICCIPELALEHTGLIEVAAESGAAEQVPLDPGRHRGWRDDVMVELELDCDSPEGIRAVAETCLAGIRALVETDALDWRPAEPSERPRSITIWVYPSGDALETFERITESVGAGWRHDRDDDVFVSSLWERTVPGATFLSPGVRSAEVTYRCWASPRRRSRRPG